MTSILKTDEIQSQNGNSVIDVANGTLKHPSASGNNLTLTASGGIKVPDGGNIGSSSDPDAMSISSAGVVTQSALPYVRVCGTGGSTSVTAGSRLPLNTELTDQGGHYDNSNFFFLTPVTGVYLINLKIYQYSGDGNTIEYGIKQSDNNSSFSNSSFLGRLRIDAAVSANDHEYFFNEAFKINSGKRVFVINSLGSANVLHYQADLNTTTLSFVLIG